MRITANVVQFSENAYAKVNLHLEILNRRHDGYHNIFSLMISVEESDLLKLETLDVYDREGPIEVEIISDGGKHEWLLATIPVWDNLITRAARAYFNKAGKSCKISLHVEKNIPAGGGLGGGSSDAAAMLRLLNSQLDYYSNDELMRLAGTIGADVPYCLSGGCAICEGTGSEVTVLDGALDYWLLIANNNVAVDTGAAYRALGRSTEHDSEAAMADRAGIDQKKMLFEKGVGANDLGVFRAVLKNDFEPVIFKDHPELEMIKNSMIEYGADYAAMTGSGSSIIGVFRDYDVVRGAEAKLAPSAAQLILTRII